ncbi:uncharacterized protein LOC143597330 [Bidens hawaiensis]|uniref:uncharacterized protein LOC143597330 n=1 Tax=Bidens hawaiensis TaxID=980011 RepID=UPI00404A1292
MAVNAVLTICWNEIVRLSSLDPKWYKIPPTKLHKIRNNLFTARSRQKSYADKRRRPLEFEFGDLVLLKVSPWKGVVRFGMKGKTSPPVLLVHSKSLKRIGDVAYRLELPQELQGIHPVFHVSNLRKVLADETLHIPLDEVRIDKTMHFVEKPVEIIDGMDKETKRSRIPLVKVRWESKRSAEVTWEREDQMKSKYPHIFATDVHS